MKIFANKEKLLKIFLALIFCIYATLLALNISAYAGGSDSSGYLNGAKLLLAGKLHIEQRAVAEISSAEIPSYSYIPLGFRPSSETQMTPTYPLGLPLLLATLSFISGLFYAPHILMWFHAIGSLIVIYHLALAFNLQRSWAVITVMALATNPLFITYSIHFMSDMPSLFWCSAAILAALKSREKPRLALYAGIAAGVAVLIRPTNIFILLPLAVIFFKDWRNLLFCGLGGFPFAILLITFNLNLYGKILATGYGNISDIFGPQFLLPSLNSYKEFLPLELTPLVILAFGILLPSQWRRDSKSVITLLIWIIPFFVFYSFYYHTHTSWWYLRFLLPTYGALILAMIITLQNIGNHLPKYRRMIAAFFLSFTFLWQYGTTPLLQIQTFQERTYFKTALWAKENLPQNSVIFSMQTSGALFHYTDFPIIRYDMLEQKDFAKIENAAQKSSKPIYAILFPFEVDGPFKEKLRTGWQMVEKIEYITIWKKDDQ